MGFRKINSSDPAPKSFSQMDRWPAAATAHVKQVAIGSYARPAAKSNNLVCGVVAVLAHILLRSKHLRKNEVAHPLTFRQHIVVKALYVFREMPSVWFHWCVRFDRRHNSKGQKYPLTGSHAIQSETAFSHGKSAIVKQTTAVRAGQSHFKIAPVGGIGNHRPIRRV